MDNDNKKSGVLEWVNDTLPNCREALRLAELGSERPLNWRERLSLKYHSPLCPFCACNKFKFELAMKKLNETRHS